MNKQGAVLLEQLADGVIEPTGHVTVRMKNERGKVISEESKPNFIAKTWKAYARALLRTRWMYLHHNLNFTGMTAGANNAVWPYGKATLPVLPMTAIGCWNDTSAEDAVNEHEMNVPGPGLIAWASRYPVGSPSGTRGLVDTTDSFVDDDTVRFVFNWAATQGNGTFQSVGWFYAGAPGIQGQNFGTAHRAEGEMAFTPGSFLTSATSLLMGGIWVDPSNGKLYTTIRRQSSSGLMRIVSADFSDVLDDSLVSILGCTAKETAMTLTTESDEFTPSSIDAAADTTSHNMLGRTSGGLSIFSYLTSTGTTWRWGKIGASPGTNTTYANPNAGSGMTVGAVIGTDVYLSGGSTDSNIYRCDTNDGSVDATIAIDANVTALCTLAGLTTPRIARMCTDGTSLFVVYTQTTPDSITASWLCVELNTSGVLQRVIGIIPHYQSSGGQTETATSPWAGATYFGKPIWSPHYEYLYSLDGPGATQAVEDTLVWGGGIHSESSLFMGSGEPGYHGIFCYDGTLYMFRSTENGAATITTAVMRMGYNLGSRVLMGSPQVKANPNTMEITYDITLPGWF